MSRKVARAVEGKHSAKAPDRRVSSFTETHQGLRTLMRGAGNAAIQRLLEGGAGPQVQRDTAFDPALVSGLVLAEAQDDAKTQEQARAQILAWLEPRRDEIETRARSTAMGFASPAQALTMSGLIAMIRQAVPQAHVMKNPRIASIVREWIHVGIPDRMTGGQVSDAEVVGAIQSVLGKPGTIRVERKGSGWMEVTAGGIEIGRDDSAPVDATMTAGWDGSIGASVSVANVKGSFQISPDRTWQAQIAFPAAATPAVLDQLAGVFGAADRAARTVAGRIDAAGGHVRAVSVDVLKDGLSPVKDAIDTMSSTVDREHRFSVGVSVKGGPEGGITVQATITIVW